MDYGLVRTLNIVYSDILCVLILVVVDYGLVRIHYCYYIKVVCSVLILVVVDYGLVHSVINTINNSSLDGLNPCCSGLWTSTTSSTSIENMNKEVLILVVVDYGLVLMGAKVDIAQQERSLNPCCSGLWTSTQQFKN